LPMRLSLILTATGCGLLKLSRCELPPRDGDRRLDRVE
jgi:hypothetical protein